MVAKKTVSIIEEGPSLKRIASEINRKFGAGTVKVASEVPLPGRIPTSSANLDTALLGGLPMGCMIELYGPEHSGKSLLSLLTIANAQKQDLECVYIDVERSFDAGWAKQLGVDVDKLLVMQIEVGEDVIDTVSKLLPARPGVIVIDSLEGMVMRDELEEGADQEFMALKARLMSRGLRKLNALNQSNTMMIWINQIRETMVMYGAKTTTPGGKALKHWAAVRLEIKRDSQLISESGKKTDTNIIAQVCNWKVVKNKTAPAYKIGSFRYFFDGHIED